MGGEPGGRDLVRRELRPMIRTATSSSDAPGMDMRDLRRSIAEALGDPSPEGDLRAFALGDLTCVVHWTPRDPPGRPSRFYQVDLRFRRGRDRFEHRTTLSDLGVLARTCEHHLRHFRLGAPAPEAVTTAPRPASDDALRARLRARIREMAAAGLGPPVDGPA